MKYIPYQYPPNYRLAQIHSQCTRPGDPKQNPILCQCCNQTQKNPIQNWIFRNMQKDFKHEAGAVAVYFSLLRFYALIMLIILCLYSWYQVKCIQEVCYISQTEQSKKNCISTYGIYIISTSDLLRLMKLNNDHRITTIMTMRAMVFFILLVMNAGALLLVGQKIRKSKKRDISIQDFTLFFKNIDLDWDQIDLREQILKFNPQIQIDQICFIYKIDRYKKWYDLAISSYFKLKQLKIPKQITKIQKIFIKSMRKLQLHQQDIKKPTGRAIVTFKILQQKMDVQYRYALDNKQIIQNFLNISQQNNKMYAQSIPSPQQLYWNCLGQQPKQKLRYKILNAFVIILLLAGSYLLTGFSLNYINNIDTQTDKKQISTAQKLFSTGIAIFIVFLGIFFRKFMQKLSEFRNPNTKTDKTLFVVITSILFHLLYYVIIPLVYFLQLGQPYRSFKLYAISYQAFNFLVIQFLMVCFDLFFCLWQRKKSKILTGKIIGLCQKQVHDELTYPRFPIQFKLIIMFKAWSFVLFYSFEMPYILGCIFIIFVTFVIKDKMNTYLHYKVQKINCKVQYIFLKVYGKFFSVYLWIIFYTTQEPNLAQTIGSAVLTVIIIILQLKFQIKQDKIQNIENINSMNISQVENKTSYKQFYQNYVQNLQNMQMDSQLKNFLEQINGHSKPQSKPVNQSNSLIGDSMNQKLIKSIYQN